MMSSSMKIKRASGFTLIELVVVIVILGILAAVAVPKFVDVGTDAKKAASDASEAAVRSAMSIAFAKHRASGSTSTGSTAGSDQWITDCASLVAYMTGGAWPTGMSCASGVITYSDGKTATLTAETSTASASIPNRT